MTKEQLQDALTWMQEIQARIAFNGIIDTEIDMSWCGRIVKTCAIH